MAGRDPGLDGKLCPNEVASNRRRGIRQSLSGVERSRHLMSADIDRATPRVLKRDVYGDQLQAGAPGNRSLTPVSVKNDAGHLKREAGGISGDTDGPKGGSSTAPQPRSTWPTPQDNLRTSAMPSPVALTSSHTRKGSAATTPRKDETASVTASLETLASTVTPMYPTGQQNRNREQER